MDLYAKPWAFCFSQNRIITSTASCPMLGAITGSLIASLPMQYFGRRKTLIAHYSIFVFGFFLIGMSYFAKNKILIYVGRVMTGFGAGFSTPVCQIYVSFNFKIVHSDFKLHTPIIMILKDKWMLITEHKREAEFTDSLELSTGYHGHVFHWSSFRMVHFGIRTRLYTSCFSCFEHLRARISELAFEQRPRRSCETCTAIPSWKVNSFPSIALNAIRFRLC